MRNYVWRLGVLAMVLSLAACAAGSPPSSSIVDPTDPAASAVSTATPEPEPVTVTLWWYPQFEGLEPGDTGNFDDWPKARAAEFMATHPGVTVNVELLTWEGGLQKLDTAVLAGSPPDLVYTINNFGGVTKYAKKGALEPIDEFLTPADLADLPESVLGAIEYEGKHYAWPWSTLVSGIAVNLDLARSRSAVVPTDKPDRSWTFKEFSDAASKLTFDSSGGSKPDVFAYPVWGREGMFYQYLWAANAGASIVDPSFSKCTLSDPKAVDGMQFLIDLANSEHVAPPGGAGLAFADANELFLQGKVAMVPAYADVLDNVKKAPKPFDVGIVAPPTAAGEASRAWNNVGSFLVFKQSDERKRSMVMEFGRYITNAENVKVLPALGVFPARVSDREAMEPNENLAQFAPLIPYGDSVFSRAFGLASPADWERAFQGMLTKESTVQQGLDSVCAAVDVGLGSN